MCNVYKPLLFQCLCSEPTDVFQRKTSIFWNTLEFSCGKNGIGICASRCNAVCSGVLFSQPLCAATWRTWHDESNSSSPVECFHGVLGYCYLALSSPLSSERGVQSQSFQSEDVGFHWHWKMLHLHCRCMRKKPDLPCPFFPHLKDLILHTVLLCTAH